MLIIVFMLLKKWKQDLTWGKSCTGDRRTVLSLLRFTDPRGSLRTRAGWGSAVGDLCSGSLPWAWHWAVLDANPELDQDKGSLQHVLPLKQEHHPALLSHPTSTGSKLAHKCGAITAVLHSSCHWHFCFCYSTLAFSPGWLRETMF